MYVEGTEEVSQLLKKSIIEAHGGKIWAQNTNGQGKFGARFSFSLPLN
jgi:signal transduction histidine kinase